MATFVLLHGAGGRGRSWRLVAAELEARGHRAIAPDLPCEEESPLEAYVQEALDAIDGDATSDGLAIVGQSLAGLIAPIVAARSDADLLVLLAAMVPTPGETGGDWWANTGHEAAFEAQALPDHTDETVYVHDVPADVLEDEGPPRHQTGRLFEDPWPLKAWPDVPTRALVCRDDRFFPAPWLSGLVRARIGIEPELVPGSHCAYLSEPVALTDALVRSWDQTARQ